MVDVSWKSNEIWNIWGFRVASTSQDDCCEASESDFRSLTPNLHFSMVHVKHPSCWLNCQAYLRNVPIGLVLCYSMNIPVEPKQNYRQLSSKPQLMMPIWGNITIRNENHSIPYQIISQLFVFFPGITQGFEDCSFHDKPLSNDGKKNNTRFPRFSIKQSNHHRLSILYLIGMR